MSTPATDDFINTLTANLSAADCVITNWHQPPAPHIAASKSPGDLAACRAAAGFAVNWSNSSVQTAAENSAPYDNTKSPETETSHPRTHNLLSESPMTAARGHPGVHADLSLSLIDLIVAADVKTCRSRACSDPLTPSAIPKTKSSIKSGDHDYRQTRLQSEEEFMAAGCLSEHTAVFTAGVAHSPTRRLNRCLKPTSTSERPTSSNLAVCDHGVDLISLTPRMTPNRAFPFGYKQPLKSSESAALATDAIPAISAPQSPNLKPIPVSKVPQKGWWKTEPCKFWSCEDRGGCRNGMNCRWAHGQHELRTELPPGITPLPPQSMKTIPQATAVRPTAPASPLVPLGQLMSTLAAAAEGLGALESPPHPTRAVGPRPAGKGGVSSHEHIPPTKAHASAMTTLPLVTVPLADTATISWLNEPAPVQDGFNFTITARRWSQHPGSPQSPVAEPATQPGASSGLLFPAPENDVLFGPLIPSGAPVMPRNIGADTIMAAAVPNAARPNQTEPLIDGHLERMPCTARAQMLDSMWKAIRLAFPGLLDADEHVLIATSPGAPPSVAATDYWLELVGVMLRREEQLTNVSSACPLCGMSSRLRWVAVSRNGSVDSSSVDSSTDSIAAESQVVNLGPSARSADGKSKAPSKNAIGILCCVDCRQITRQKGPETAAALQALAAANSILPAAIQIQKLLRLVQDGNWPPADLDLSSLRKKKSLLQQHREMAARLCLLFSNVWGESVPRGDVQALAMSRFSIAEFSAGGLVLVRLPHGMPQSPSRPGSSGDCMLSLLEWLALARQPLVFVALVSAGILLPVRMLAAFGWEAGSSDSPLDYLLGDGIVEDSATTGSVAALGSMDPALTQTWASLL